MTSPQAERSASRPRRRGERGFTLLEVMIVLVILGLVLGLVIARGPMHSRTLDVRAAAAEVARMMRTARGQAIATDRPVEVVVDLRLHSLRLGAGPARPLPAGLGVRVIAKNEETLGTRLAGFRFEPDGSASGGQVELRDPGGLRMQIGVDWLTGRVSVVDVPNA
jgi:general secretion pathway protein H